MATNNTNAQVSELKNSFFSIASSAYSSSKTAFTRAKQFTEERMGSVEKTEYDAQFEALSVRADSTKFWTEKLLKSTEALIEPNPGARVEGLVYEKLDKKLPTRPTNLYGLGTTMCEAGQEFGPGTAYGSSLGKTGSTLKKLGNAEKDFAQKATSHFHYPLRNFIENDMKTIAKERRSLATARLDLDACKNKVKKAQTPEKMKQAEAELRVAQAEFDRQYEITRLLLDGVSTTQANHLASLNSFVEALGMYYAQSQQYITELQKQLQDPLDGSTGGSPSVPPARPSATPLLPATQSPEQGRPQLTRKAKVLYDYDASDKSELSLLADEVIIVYSVEGLDSDWMIGERGKQKGKVPVTYLELL